MHPVQSTTAPRRRSSFLFRIYLVVVHAALIYLVADKIVHRKGSDAGEVMPAATQLAGGDSTAGYGRDTALIGQPSQSAPAQSAAIASSSNAADTTLLMIPVVGVRRADIQDTYEQSRSEGRTHHASDIAAPEGTPVVAVASGSIAKFFESKQGGITIYQWSADSSRVYYYAHLQRRQDGLAEGARVRRGDVLGYVGNTGNAGPGNFHLHFSIIIPKTKGRHWEGDNINPYPLLANGVEARRE